MRSQISARCQINTEIHWTVGGKHFAAILQVHNRSLKGACFNQLACPNGERCIVFCKRENASRNFRRYILTMICASSGRVLRQVDAALGVGGVVRVTGEQRPVVLDCGGEGDALPRDQAPRRDGHRRVEQRAPRGRLQRRDASATCRGRHRAHWRKGHMLPHIYCPRRFVFPPKFKQTAPASLSEQSMSSNFFGGLDTASTES